MPVFEPSTVSLMLVAVEAGNLKVSFDALFHGGEDISGGRLLEANRCGLVGEVHGDIFHPLDGLELTLHLQSARRASGHSRNVHHDLGFSDGGGDWCRFAVIATGDQERDG